MKKFITVFAFLLFPSLLMAQTYFTEDFGGGTFPPSGWTIDAYAGNWSANNSNNAGGLAPEARFTWSPQFVGESRLICPPMDLTGVVDLKVEFRYNLDHYGGPYTIGVATRSGGGSWNLVWSLVDPTASVPATTEYVTINNSDVGASDFQICWFFSGDSYNLNDWYIDDCRLFTPLAHDVMVRDILIETQYAPGATVIPKGLVKNFGLGTETFDVTCEIKIDGSSAYTQTSSPVTLTPDEEQTVTFPDYVAAASNELFEMIITTNLSGDLDPSNDSMTKWFNTYTTLREMVLLEIGTGTWCTYCPGAAMGADDLVENGHSVAVVEYHNGDNFTNSYSDARNTYYGISGFPTAIFGGVDYFVGGDHNISMYDNYLPIFEGRKAINCAFDVGIFGTSAAQDYELTIQLEKQASIPADWDNLVLHVALTESHIPFNWQGQTEVSFVERLMMPDELGTMVDLMNNSNISVDLNFSLDPTWVTDECELVAFIQNLNNKEILQGSKVKLLDLMPVPVELTTFTASTNKSGIVLNWSTASEINNHGFEVERSQDDKTFYRIGFVKGTGTTTEIQSYSFVDDIEYSGVKTYYYRLRQVDFDGRSQYSDVVNVDFDVPKDFVLSQNYPNPFNPSTKITYALPNQSPVVIKVYDLTGQEVITLVDEVKEAGTYEINFDALNFSSGVYIYQMRAGDFSSVKKMSILK
ncbi:MAG: hypothetical protein DRQ13_04905 [Ignavibacteriae bacterium]|nr:MAG: hypothetical protein DRQ13_04905 [Ignavibacteriota bacterium]